MQRRNFIRVTGGHAVVAALGSTALTGCTAGMPAEAVEAWTGPGASVAADVDVRRWLLSYAILAPHSHNLQSWFVDLGTPNEIVLSCDQSRLLPQTDPQYRQIMMSHGTFLELLDLAARERGLKADITLFPQGVFGLRTVDVRPIARIRLVTDASVQKDPLFRHILQRHTNRSAYDIARPVAAEAWQAMVKAATQSGVRFGFVDLSQPAAMAAHRQIASEAWRIELTTPRIVMETYQVLRVGATEVADHRDGLVVLDPLVVLMSRVGLFDRSKAPAPDAYATTSQIKDFDKKLESTPGFLWMVSAGNDRVTQINAGRAYARVQLAATGLGVSMQPLQQALQEYPEQEKPYADIRTLLDAHEPAQTVQMWARVGYASPVGPAPRRRLKSFIRV